MIKLGLPPLPPQVDSAVLQRVAAAASGLLAADDSPRQVNLSLVDADSMKVLNEKYAQVSDSTDVLSFNYQEDGFVVADELGDIAINIDEAARQVGPEWDLTQEVAWLLAHGLLHLLGRDHQTPSQQIQMAAEQQGLMQTAGLKIRALEWK